MTGVCSSTWFWVLLGLGFFVAEAGITWLSVIGSARRGRDGVQEEWQQL